MQNDAVETKAARVVIKWPSSLVMGIPTLRRYDLLRAAVISVLSGTVIPDRIIIVDNGGKLPEAVREAIGSAAIRANTVAEIVAPGRNIGVAASWNLIKDMAPEAGHLLIANDDTTAYQGTVSGLVAAAAANPQEMFFFPAAAGYKNAWSFFLQRAESWNRVGPYDEMISPGYGFFEDNDYSYRLQLAGLRHVPVKGCAYGHVDSATMKSMSESELKIHWQRFALARSNYVAKWGGEPGHERFGVPFNGERPDYALRAAPTRRNPWASFAPAKEAPHAGS